MKIITNNSAASKNVVVFLQSDLGVGGIETYFYRQMLQLSERNIPVVWVSDKHSYIAPSFQDGLKQSSIIIWKNHIDYKGLYKLTDGRSDAQIVFISSYLNWFVTAERFRRKHHWCRMDNFFFVNHFTGWMNYLETAYPKFLQNSVRMKLSKIIQKMNQHGNIRYFSKRHITVMEERYNYQAIGETDLPPDIASVDFDAERCRQLYCSKIFNILSVSRFDFPHKGFLLGLIRVYGKLKAKYKQITLTIVGYGSGERLVNEEIAKLSPEAQADIQLHGAVAPEELTQFYNQANVNVSTAGCCSTGAKNGTLSLPARNYCMDCEVYGFFPAAKGKSVSADPGFPVENFIIEILTMNENEYIQKCKDSYDTFNDNSQNAAKLEDMRNLSEESTLSKRNILYIERAFRKVMRKTKIYTYKRAIKENGVFSIIKKHIKRCFRRNK